MPAPKYFCDYCEKQFQDTPQARRRHLQGSLHQRAKKAWFDSFNESGQEDWKQGVCSYFMRTGTCQFGQNCKYAHPPQPLVLPQFGNSQSDDYGSSMASHSASQMASGPKIAHSGEQTLSLIENKLPPSLQPPPEGGYPPLSIIDWG